MKSRSKVRDHLTLKSGWLAAYFALAMFVVSSTGWTATYYVDKDNSRASDSNTGTESSPWKTIQNGASVAKAGDTVYVKGGVYYEWVDVKNSGTSGNPITFKAYPGSRPIIDGSQTTIRASYDGLFTARNKNYITVDGFEVRNSNGFLIRLSYGDHLTVRNCIVHDNDGPNGEDTNQSGILIDHSNAGLVEYNESYHSGHNALDAQSTNNVTFQFNYAHDNPNHNGINIFPKTAESQIDYTGNNVRYNILTGATNGINMWHQTNNEVVGNLIYNNISANGVGIHISAMTGDSSTVDAYTKIYNNTIVDNLNHGIRNTNANHLTIKNNIIAYNGLTAIYTSTTTGHDINNNLYDNSSNYRWDGNLYSSLSSWQSASGQDSNSSEADPNFADRPNYDYRLTASSTAAIDSGLDLSSDGIVKDLDGISRPQGNGFDIGAYEYGQGGSNTNHNPVAVNDSAATLEDTTVTINVLANDTDVDGDALFLAGVSAPAHGNADIVGSTVVYTPSANYNGSDTFSYTVSDGKGGVASASAAITVNSAIDAPDNLHLEGYFY
jgi:hypothetical protein